MVPKTKSDKRKKQIQANNCNKNTFSKCFFLWLKSDYSHKLLNDGFFQVMNTYTLVTCAIILCVSV